MRHDLPCPGPDFQRLLGRFQAASTVLHGSYARFILLFVQSEAIKTGSREIELGRSMRVWLGNMDLSIG